METDESSPAPRPTREEAMAALGDTTQIQNSVNKVAATPWPLWFTTVLALYLGAIPLVVGGSISESGWLLPQTTWQVIETVMMVAFVIMFGIAAHRWKLKTGVALRLDILPKWASLSLLIGYPALMLAAIAGFLATEAAGFLYAISALGVAVAIAAHLRFVRLHRETP